MAKVRAASKEYETPLREKNSSLKNKNEMLRHQTNETIQAHKALEVTRNELGETRNELEGTHNELAGACHRVAELEEQLKVLVLEKENISPFAQTLAPIEEVNYSLYAVGFQDCIANLVSTGVLPREFQSFEKYREVAHQIHRGGAKVPLEKEIIDLKD